MNINNLLPKVSDEYINVAHHYRIAWVTQKAKSLKRGSKILDAGAGECPFKDLFKHCEYKSQDFSEYQGQTKGPQKETWQYGKLDYISDITAIPVPDKSFDAVLCTEVLEHVPYPIESIKEFGRILKKGGRLFITAPLASGLHQEPYHFYGGYTPHFYNKFLKDNGFKVVEIIPQGGLFKHAAQEVHRTSRLIDEKKLKNSNKLYNFLLRNIIPRYLGNMDSHIKVPEFTIGYMVEAVKQK